jgi:predicted RNA-binding Zn-ribbon protein involved in translation (DUF1610 family)
MSNRIFYCPKCGDISIEFDDDEHYCTNTSTCKKIKMINTHKTSKYFFNKYFEGKEKCDEVLFKYDLAEEVRKEFVYDNPLYDKEADMKSQADYKRIEDKNLKATRLEQSRTNTDNTPHCPTCSSTDIEKISTSSKVGKAALFGIFSIGSITKQFKCKNCGYKW